MAVGEILLESHPRSGLRRTLETLPHILDRYVGLIQSIDWYTPRHNEPQLVHCHATLADLSHVTGRRCSRATGGTALTRDIALAKAIGESVERYCGDLYNLEEFVFASYRALRPEATDPSRFILFHPRQYGQPGFPFTPPREDIVIGWVHGFSLTRKKPTLLPAALVHLSYQSPSWRECFDLGPVSGYACGNTFEEAILSGLYEVIERDSFMIFWFNQLPVPGFDLHSARSPSLQRTLDRYHSAPVSLFCANITTDIGVPAALAVMVSREPGWPAAVVATAANLDAEQAIARAFQELAANHLYIRSYFEDPRRRLPQAPHEVVNQEDHGLLYCSPNRLRQLDAVLRPRWMIRPEDIANNESDDVKANVDYCVRKLADLGLEVIVVDLTTPEVESLGLKVVKVLVPGIQPLDFGTQWLHLGGRRIYEAPVRMGYRQANTKPHELNLFPHPFP